jgi:hypothetical protein
VADQHQRVAQAGIVQRDFFQQPDVVGVIKIGVKIEQQVNRRSGGGLDLPQGLARVTGVTLRRGFVIDPMQAVR